MPRLKLIKFIPLLLVLLITLSCRQSVQPLDLPTYVYLVLLHPIRSSQPHLHPQWLRSFPLSGTRMTSRSFHQPPMYRKNYPRFASRMNNISFRAGDTVGSLAAQISDHCADADRCKSNLQPRSARSGTAIDHSRSHPGRGGSGFKIIPDSELIYGPYAASFDINEFVGRYDSYLSRYSVKRWKGKRSQVLKLCNLWLKITR